MTFMELAQRILSLDPALQSQQAQVELLLPENGLHYRQITGLNNSPRNAYLTLAPVPEKKGD